MIDFSNLLPKNLYHSYVIESNEKDINLDLLKFLESRGEIEHKSPDVLSEYYESFTIDDSHHIKEWHSQKGLTEGKKVCIISTKFINREAEQTLLKIVEEPSQNTHFFLIVPDSSVLLDTILSRVQVVRVKQLSNDKLRDDVLLFINSNTKNRIDQISSIIKNNKDDDNSSLKFYAISFINELEKLFYEKFRNNKNDKVIQRILEEIINSRKYLNIQGASVKMILENLAIII